MPAWMKEMTIYELEKQATPGPHDRGSGFAEATLTRHCRNNFMRALASLKMAQRMLDSEYPTTDHRHPTQWGLDQLIAELEEVK